MPLNDLGQRVGDALESWSRRPSPSRAALQGRYACVEPLAAAHATALFQAFALRPDARDWTYLSRDRVLDPSQFERDVEARSASLDPLFFAILPGSDDGDACGTAALMRIDRDNGVIEIGHVEFAPALQRTRAATEAIALLLGFVFSLGYRRVEWKCDSLNERSRRSAARFGFTFEGVFRQAVVVKGRNRDTAWFSMLDQEWPANQRAFERWLDPENFDASGRQKRALAELRSS